MENEQRKSKLVGKIYKLLPIYEGKVLNKNEVLDKQIAYENFQKNINMLLMYLMGIKNRYGYNEYLENIILLIEGLKTVGTDNHTVVKKTIFGCVKISEKMLEKFNIEDLN